MANTTNYSWETPDDTDLVKDGAAAIRTLGTAIDTTVFNNASAAIAKTIVDAKGDIIAATAADTVSRLAVGANDTVLTADSSTATGLKWAAPAGGGGKNYSLLNTGGTTLSGTTTTISGISGKDDLLVIVDDASGMNNGSSIGCRINSVSSGYFASGIIINAESSYADNNFSGNAYDDFSNIPLGAADNGTPGLSASVRLSGCNTTGLKVWSAVGGGTAAGGSGQVLRTTQGRVAESATVSSIVITSSSGSFSGGVVYVYGAA